MDILSLFNWASFIVFIISAVLIAAKLSTRFLRFRRYHMRVPTLLKRDLILFWSIVIYLETTLLALITGVQGLGREPIWVIPRSLLLISAFVYWAIVEYKLEDPLDRKKDE